MVNFPIGLIGQHEGVKTELNLWYPMVNGQQGTPFSPWISDASLIMFSHVMVFCFLYFLCLNTSRTHCGILPRRSTSSNSVLRLRSLYHDSHSKYCLVGLNIHVQTGHRMCVCFQPDESFTQLNMIDQRHNVTRMSLFRVFLYSLRLFLDQKSVYMDLVSCSPQILVYSLWVVVQWL